MYHHAYGPESVLTRNTASHPDRVYMAELEKELNRRRATIRGWERDELLPKWLLPKRDEADWRYWTRKQVEGLKAWMKRNDMRPGKGIAKRETPEYLEKLRQPRKQRAAA